MVANVAAGSFADRLRQAKAVARKNNRQIALAVGVHHVTVSDWLGGQLPQGDTIRKLSEFLGVSREWLEYGTGAAKAPFRVVAEAPAGYATRAKLPPRAYERVYQYVERMRAAEIPDDMIEEAERLMVDPLYSKINKRDIRERSEEDLITDIDAAWSWIREVVEREWGKQLR